MNFIELVNKYQGEILENSVLIEYDLFFDCMVEKYCKFSIDEYKELEKLNKIIIKIKESDKNAEIYVCTYGIDFLDERIHIYGDTLWINTKIDIKEIYNYFKNFREIEPSDMVLLSEDELIDGTVSLVFYLNGKVEDYNTFIKCRKLSEIKSLYWD